MPTVDLQAVRSRLLSLPAGIDDAALGAALKDLGRDGALDGPERAMLDELKDRMQPGARSRYDAFLGVPPQGAPSTPRPTLGTTAAFAAIASGTAVMKEGASGPAVRSLQEALLSLNLGSWTPTEYFGPRTKQAVMELQVAWNDRLVAPLVPRGAAPLTVDGVLGKNTLAALDHALASTTGPAAVSPRIGGGVDKADLVVDLKKQVAYLSVERVDPAKLDALLASLDTEATARTSATYATLRSKIAPGGVLVDDYEARPIKSEAELGLEDSDGKARLFIAFPVAVGEPASTSSGYLTPTGSFVVGDKRKNREASQWGHTDGFRKDPQNPFGPRWLRLYRETAGGGRSHTAYGLHGTTASATWMNKSDGQRAVSHGCVRFQNHDIIKLFEYLPDGARVRIVNGLADQPPALPPNV